MERKFVHYTLAVPSMDEEHKGVLKILYDIKRMMNEGIDITSERIEDLKEHFLAHYKMEEEWMDKVNFPYAVYHKESHSDSIKTFNKTLMYLNKFSVGDLIEHIFSHIDHEDRKIAEWDKAQERI